MAPGAALQRCAERVRSDLGGASAGASEDATCRALQEAFRWVDAMGLGW